MPGDVNMDLLNAALRGGLTGVKAALKAGADVNFALPQKDGPMPDVAMTGPYTALYITAGAGHVDVVKLLLRKGASLVMRCTGYGLAPLHAAAMEGHTEVVELLVRHGATVDIKQGHNMTPIILALLRGQVDTVRRLIELGARVDLIFGPKNFTPPKHWNTTHYDKDSKQTECFRLAQEAHQTRLLRCCNPKCNKAGYRSDLKLCAACKLTRYCSRECQKQHWSRGHKKCCGQDGVYW